jgi:AcrR family transcriptional regulator
VLEHASTGAGIATVREGVFFTRPGALPRGRHKLTREQVTSTQRERLLVATTELLAALGYRRFGPGEIASRAGVSLAAFYDCFENKDACIFAGYDRSIEVIMQNVAVAERESDDRTEVVRSVLRAYLETLGGDPVVARAYVVEIDALGKPARERRTAAINLFAQYIRNLDLELSEGREALPWSAYVGVAYATRQLVSDALDAEDEPDLLALGDDLDPWLIDIFRER